MVKNPLYNQNEAQEPEELENDPEFKELGDENLEEETENPKSTDEDDALKEEEISEAE